jgi:hypothetical protein
MEKFENCQTVKHPRGIELGRCDHGREKTLESMLESPVLPHSYSSFCCIRNVLGSL